MFIRILLTAIFFIGLIWDWNLSASFFAFTLIILLFLITNGVKLRKLALPDLFLLFFAFTGIIFIYELWRDFRNKYGIEFLLNLVSGGILWIIFYNKPKYLTNIFVKILTIFGILIPLVYLITLPNLSIKLLRDISILSFDLPGHRHMGDYLVLPTLVFLNQLSFNSKPQLKTVFLLIWSLAFILIASSRSAIISLTAGVYVLFSDKGLLNRFVFKYKFILISLLFGIFIYISSTKSILFNRQYYFQGLWGLLHYPWGVGFGRFGVVSADPASHILGFNGYSGSAFNLILEVLSGYGVWGSIFVIWFLQIIRQILIKRDNNLLFKALFLSLSVNFMFDNTYATPAMLFIWFMLLGLNDSDSLEKPILKS